MSNPSLRGFNSNFGNTGNSGGGGGGGMSPSQYLSYGASQAQAAIAWSISQAIQTTGNSGNGNQCLPLTQGDWNTIMYLAKSGKSLGQTVAAVERRLKNQDKRMQKRQQVNANANTNVNPTFSHQNEPVFAGGS